jgi:predicted DNA-binding transcriptional regulator AlpA
MPKGKCMDIQSHQRATDILSPSDAARCVGLAVSTLGKLRCRGGGPEFIKLGRKVAYRRAALDEWLAARVVTSTSDAARLPGRLTEAR